ncbi:MAG: energy transducer TonB [Pseudomonadota bacterium]|jgi:protein TonB|nr:TonB-dependent receptor [Gammaproteobacteria bacterium]MEC7773839.1 energy transducer TonB [Pseudomonadota bacterium]|tara:strand:- start:250 stop:951 length:702 start_codon:yes stop_codon:yes gene_type:complete
MNQVLAAINSVTKPIHEIYVKAFNANKYAAGIGFSSAITLALFFVMVILISLGDTGMKEDTSVKLADIVMPDREIDTFMTEVEKPDKPEEQPEDIAQPELDLAPLTGIDVSIAKPKPNFKAGGSFFRDGEYIPLFKVVPIYPRRAQERGTMGYALVEFTITDTGSVENAQTIEGYCSSKRPDDPEVQFRPCSMFNSASARAALKLKYKPKIVDGRAVPVDGVLHRFTYILDDS